MSKGIFLINTNYFFELKSKLIIGKGPGADITLEGELAPQQVQIILFENEVLIKNLATNLPVTVDRKILPEKFFLPLINLSLIEVGDIQFIYSEEGAPRTFQIKKILEDFDQIQPYGYDPSLIEKANNIQGKIDALTQKIKPAIAEMEKIKNEIAALIKERDQKAHEYHLQINEKKIKFEQIKVENTKSFDELNANKLEIKKVLKEASAAKVSGKLELDK